MRGTEGACGQATTVRGRRKRTLTDHWGATLGE